ncbi:FMN-dependent oxidoreductase (nitrilotriacetate monooxygenase family) [Methylobacterium sp. PvP062]|jgi:FMN-dependent oxidoreductase (nitrilotriacetate monooxygenase family)|uniref:FMN-dependent oxidoreductase (Nitrilotriacetate monooxygenase family) n=2 Tax=Methylobacterium radiotolerans TaxID=31998 RepID=A0ABV2NS03_9HYPH|nr:MULTISPECIES: LLM class flavin-dependent oxidoreductase [Methylobacterium]MCX7335405.1 LLM class flavin-dependent oxidoreductase [Hyphomicrobiales bacterium]GAN48115.1 monooxygenase [Methylobacterium sp. ME121]ACB27807.1 putative nitrilotriacetate monooxygenase component A [Methylobacterium radiotolerans JCM 2831]KIU28875.1 monooxygenase [Methylobacterium radiotolerans]MBN6819321.1 LLM class flavin-dependent oxidoreductase [Methylobacterium organophilum]
MSGRTLHLNVNLLHSGVYPSAWRLPDSRPDAFVDIDHFVRVARVAERGKLDAIFLADTPAINDRIDYRPFNALEPTVVLASVAAATSHVGLVATASTTYNEPYNLARRFASLDMVSRGRAGWNVVTTADAAAGRNFGFAGASEHGARYARAREFTELVHALWDSWEDDAFVGDKAGGRFVDTGKVHAIRHRGAHYAVEGPLTVPRSPQGRPVTFQAGGSEDGRELAAATADAVFSLAQTVADGAAYARDLRARAARYGRAPDALVILPGLATVIGSTEAEARRRQDALWNLVPVEYSLARLAGTLRIDPARLDLDRPLPDPLPLPPDANHTMFLGTVALARRDGLTVRQLLRALGGGVGHRIVAGTPEAIADDIEAWFRAGAADGFNLMPDVLPDGLETFVDAVVPILQRRGLFRRDYAGATLRDHLGLARPPSRDAAGDASLSA